MSIIGIHNRTTRDTSDVFVQLKIQWFLSDKVNSCALAESLQRGQTIIVYDHTKSVGTQCVLSFYGKDMCDNLYTKQINLRIDGTHVEYWVKDPASSYNVKDAEDSNTYGKFYVRAHSTKTDLYYTVEYHGIYLVLSGNNFSQIIDDKYTWSVYEFNTIFPITVDIGTSLVCTRNGITQTTKLNDLTLLDSSDLLWSTDSSDIYCTLPRPIVNTVIQDSDYIEFINGVKMTTGSVAVSFDLAYETPYQAGLPAFSSGDTKVLEIPLKPTAPCSYVLLPREIKGILANNTVYDNYGFDINAFEYTWIPTPLKNTVIEDPYNPENPELPEPAKLRSFIDNPDVPVIPGTPSTPGIDIEVNQGTTGGEGNDETGDGNNGNDSDDIVTQPTIDLSMISWYDAALGHSDAWVTLPAQGEPDALGVADLALKVDGNVPLVPALSANTVGATPEYRLFNPTFSSKKISKTTTSTGMNAGYFSIRKKTSKTFQVEDGAGGGSSLVVIHKNGKYVTKSVSSKSFSGTGTIYLTASLGKDDDSPNSTTLKLEKSSSTSYKPSNSDTKQTIIIGRIYKSGTKTQAYQDHTGVAYFDFGTNPFAGLSGEGLLMFKNGKFELVPMPKGNAPVYWDGSGFKTFETTSCDD